jgi:hypothetical protein
MTRENKTTDLDPGEVAVLMQLSRERPTEDGDIIGKASRDALIRRGLAHRAWGRTTLTVEGEVERIMRLTDDQVLAEALAEGVDVQTEAARFRAMFKEAVSRAKRS